MSAARFCTNCGAAIDGVARFCGKCGSAIAEEPHSLNSSSDQNSAVVARENSGRRNGHRGRKKAVLVAIVLVGAVVVIATLSSSDSPQGGSDASGGNTGITGQHSVVIIPQEEQKFISIVASAQKRSRNVDNDMQLGGVKAQRDRDICTLLSSSFVSDWVGKVQTVDSNSDGKGVLAISLAPDITVTTWNNAFSDIGSNTLIEPGTSVFDSASAMKPGETVKFSGAFLPTMNDDCILESSITLSGKVQSPDFIFRFSSIAAYAGSANQGQMSNVGQQPKPQASVFESGNTDAKVPSVPDLHPSNASPPASEDEIAKSVSSQAQPSPASSSVNGIEAIKSGPSQAQAPPFSQTFSPGDIPQDLWGSWSILRIVAGSGKATCRNSVLKKLLGSELKYASTSLQWENIGLVNPHVHVAPISNSGLSAEWHVSLATLGLSSSSTTEIVLHHPVVSSTGEIPGIPGDDVLVKGPNSILFPLCGVWFEAVREGSN